MERVVPPSGVRGSLGQQFGNPNNTDLSTSGSRDRLESEKHVHQLFHASDRHSFGLRPHGLPSFARGRGSSVRSYRSRAGVGRAALEYDYWFCAAYFGQRLMKRSHVAGSTRKRTTGLSDLFSGMCSTSRPFVTVSPAVFWTAAAPLRVSVKVPLST